MRNERTPRTLAETTFATGYPETTFATGYPEATTKAREPLMYAAFLGWLLALLLGTHLVARHWGAIVALFGG